MKKKKYPVELFSHVNCTGYMKPIIDGVHIEIRDTFNNICTSGPISDISYTAKAIIYHYHTLDEYDSITGFPLKVVTKEVKDLSGWCGETVEKTYYERVEKNFTGVLVGYKKLVTKRYLGTDWCDYYIDDTDKSYGYCFKTPSEVIDVAIVYYKNNCKRYVRLEDLYNESMEDR